MKKFSRQWYCKFTAYVMLLALTAGFIISTLTLGGKVSDPSAFESKTYAESSTCEEEFSRVINNVLVMQYDYVSEENVRNGGALSEADLYSSIYNGNAYNRYRQNYFDQRQSYDSDEGVYTETLPAASDFNMAIVQQHPDWDFFQDGVFVLYLSENPQVIETTRQSMIDNQLRNFQRVKTFLETVQGQFVYNAYRQETDAALKNGEADEIKKMPIYTQYDLLEENMVRYEGGQAQGWRDLGNYYFGRYSGGNADYNIGAHDKLLVGITPEYLAARESEWTNDHKIATDCVTIMIVCALLSLMLLIYLCVVTGRVPDETGVRLCLIDRMYSEIHLALLIGLACIVVGALDGMGSSVFNMWPLATGIGCGAVAAGLPLLLSLVRALKAHRFFRSFALGRLCIRVCSWIARTVRGIWEGGSLMMRGVLLAALVPLLCMPLVTVPFIMAALIYLVYRMVSRFQRIQEGVRQVRGGNLDYKIEVKGGDLGALASDINTLSEGLDAAISSEVKAERLKTELISNVSHDIKTPLTSIVTYVDLLQNELQKEQPDHAALREYADVIERKTGRLRVLTTDLFEAAKATSGAMTVNLEQVDVQALVRQGLGEFDDKLTAAQLDMRVAMPEKPLYISADGRLVWRIFENMLSNVVKYALPGSRVYLDVSTGQGQVWITMKNISAYELNVPAEELMERFKRGDESRSSEGSGLGLSIATSLAQLQHGVFTIAVDGDLFKSTLAMPVYRPASETEKKDEK